MTVALDPNNSFRPGLNSQEERTPIHLSRADQTSHVSSIESLSNRRDCGGCAEISCMDVIGGIFRIAFTVIALPIVLVIGFCMWAYEGIEYLLSSEPTNVPPDLLNIDPEAAEIGSHYQINVEKRGQAPDRIDWNAVLNGVDISQVQVAELLDRFDDVYGRDPAQTNFDDITVAQRTQLRNSISSYVNFINARNLNSAQYYDQITLFVKNIILELRKPEISAEKKQNVFTELSDAAGNCYPRRIEEALRQFRYITNRPDTIDNRIREWAQGYKEDIILRYFQRSESYQGQFHALNHARQVVRGWGLDQPDALSGQDGSARGLGATREAYLQRLHENYSPAHVISMVQTKIVFFEENDLVNEYLATEYAREGSPLFENDEMLGRIFEHKVLEDGREVSEITTYGTAKLLELLGFIDPIQS